MVRAPEQLDLQHSPSNIWEPGKAQHPWERLGFHLSEWLGEDISKIQVSFHIVKAQVAFLNSLTDIVVGDIDVLRAWVECIVFRESDGWLIIGR